LENLYLEYKPCTIAQLRAKAAEKMDKGEFYAHLYYIIYDQVIKTDLYKKRITDGEERIILGDFF
jgi:hypothetical protein